mmetsp:Transcript_146803/g.256361  ORF Transcript_146803/g.256361 Transcript_146803/m.256361 type:complete len:205 (-) Transcript_146803:256-870(-)
MEKGETQGGFYEPQPTGRQRLSQGRRGRVVAQTTEFPPRWSELCMQYLLKAQELCPALRCEYTPTTCLVNFYDEQAEFKWHKDSENPERIRSGTTRPIVSLSVGDSADFGYKMDYDSPEFEKVKLESGDVLVFGGKWRMMVHSVLQIHPKTRPSGIRMPHAGRLNVTFRDVDGWIDTSQFPAYRVVYDIEEPPTAPGRPQQTLP